jgi:hypothetical protein
MGSFILRAAVTISLLTVIFRSESFAKPICIDIVGESIVVSGDIPSAKVEAINRAKFSAVEQIAGVEIKSKTVIENSLLLDDLITTQTSGAVSSFNVVSFRIDGTTAKATVNVCVEPINAKSSMSALALNTAISVYLPAKKLIREKTRENDDENIVAQTLIGKLAEAGFSVRDLADANALELKDAEMALNGGDQTLVRSLVYRYLTNSVLVGKIDPVVSVKKGTDIGYGISTPFISVTARLSYRLMARDVSGKMVVVTAGSEEAKGLALNQEDAYSEAQKNISSKFVPVIIEKILSRLGDIATKITVVVEGVNSPAETIAVREQIQRVVWVSKVEEKGIGEFMVSYPENPIYLASGLTQKGFTVVSYSKDTIRVKPK